MTNAKQAEDEEEHLIEVRSVNSSASSAIGDAARSCWARIVWTLEFISVGQYYTKLYHRGKGTQSSIVGGILTIICALILVSYAVVILVPIFNRDNYNLDIKP
jgi:hypothetical protein